ncbi:MAG: hypothetical protein GY807_06120, partial [Gammaproteobacteria bacterium]|nr:hypothetical protein [Gammaproteobacteria bacterium]
MNDRESYSTAARMGCIDLWGTGKMLSQAFKEQKTCIKAVYDQAHEVIQSPDYTPAEYRVEMDAIPESFYSLRKNIFSTLFQSMYQLLDIKRERRMLYGKLNHLFRIWVTSADNLLDQEDKVTIPLRMCGSSHVMRQVVSIMTADRVLKKLLDDAVQSSDLSLAQSQVIAERSLQVLLPSAAQEASEEGGITHRPRPGVVLSTIHTLKTGLLFNVPFLGPEAIEEEVDLVKLRNLKEALLKFGLGCQLLDDIRDMAKDYREQRHNVILSQLVWTRDPYLTELEPRTLNLNDRIYQEIPQVVLPTARLAFQYLRDGLRVLRAFDLDLHETA